MVTGIFRWEVGKLKGASFNQADPLTCEAVAIIALMFGLKIPGHAGITAFGNLEFEGLGDPALVVFGEMEARNAICLGTFFIPKCNGANIDSVVKLWNKQVLDEHNRIGIS